MKRSLQFLTLGLLVCGLLASAPAAVETYKIDSVHSSVGFTIRYFVTTVPGHFTRFAGTIVVDRDHLENSTVEARIEVASIDTEFGIRDDDLRSDRFFSAANLPFITFKSKFWEKIGEDTFAVTGDLKIRDVTKEVVLKTKSLGFGPGRTGAMVSGWEASTTINRNDFGITVYPKVLGDDVAITITVGADLQN
jgi:polyisoprenoid-binding protein YceI